MSRTSRGQRGDTIIEVLLAMSVIGLVLGAAFGIASRSVSIGQDAQERTEALKIAETQLEIFRSLYKDKVPAVTSRTNLDPFCIDATAATPSVYDFDNDVCTFVNGNGEEGLYSIEIKPPLSTPGPSSAYEFVVSWFKQGTSERNNVTLYYKPGKL